MDKFVIVAKSSAHRHVATSPEVGKASSDSGKSRPLYAPYDTRNRAIRKPNNWRDREKTEKLVAPLLKDNAKPSATAITKHLLKTLSDECNPITHSDIYTRTDYVTSAASGHQRSEGSVNRAELRARGTKLRAQYSQNSGTASFGTSSPSLLRGVIVYIDGYLSNTTDTEMKRIVALAGGQVSQTAAGATHILTSQQLSGSKTHKLLTTKSKVKVHVVRPEWVSDSVKTGKRLPERTYSAVKGSATLDAFLAGPSSKILLDEPLPAASGEI